MIQRKRFLPGNPIVFVSDSDFGNPPEPSGEITILSTPSCVSMPCTSFIDGGTQFTLGDARAVMQSNDPSFDGMLEIPHRKVVISTAEDEIILAADWPDQRVRVRIWTNKAPWPDEVVVGLG